MDAMRSVPTPAGSSKPSSSQRETERVREGRIVCGSMGDQERVGTHGCARNRERQTETDRDRQRQTETDRDRQRLTD